MRLFQGCYRYNVKENCQQSNRYQQIQQNLLEVHCQTSQQCRVSNFVAPILEIERNIQQSKQKVVGQLQTEELLYCVHLASALQRHACRQNDCLYRYEQEQLLLIELAKAEKHEAPAEVPQVLYRQVQVAPLGAIEAVDEVAALLLQHRAHKKEEREREASRQKEEQHGVHEEHLVGEPVAPRERQMAQADIREVDDVPLDQGLRQGLLEEGELPEEDADLVVAEHPEQRVQHHARQNVLGQHVDEKGEVRLQQN